MTTAFPMNITGWIARAGEEASVSTAAESDIRTEAPSAEGRPLPILVGTDGSRNSEAAVEWAAHLAAAGSVPVTVVYVLEREKILATALPREELEDHANTLAEAAAEQVRSLHSDVQASSKVVVGSPAQMLSEEAGDDHLLVVGRRGLGGFGRLLMGSTSTAVANRARCPLVVVPADWQPAPMPGPVVVGVDCSKENEAAIAVAFATARASQVPLHAVRTWDVDILFAGRLADVMGGVGKYEQEAAKELADTIEKRSADYPDVEVHQDVRRGHRVEGLAAASVGAGLLVVGAHGHRRLGGTPLGSVTRGVLHHASVPVAVIPR